MKQFESKDALINAKIESSIRAVTEDGDINDMSAVIRQETTSAERRCKLHTLPTARYIIEGFGWAPAI